jgi:hypothetical protein
VCMPESLQHCGLAVHFLSQVVVRGIDGCEDFDGDAHATPVAAPNLTHCASADAVVLEELAPIDFPHFSKGCKLMLRYFNRLLGVFDFLLCREETKTEKLVAFAKTPPQAKSDQEGPGAERKQWSEHVDE